MGTEVLGLATAVRLGPLLGHEARRLCVLLEALVPCDQVRLRFRLEDQNGARVENEVYLAVHHVPEE